MLSLASSDTVRKGLLGSGQAQKPASPAGRYLLYAIGEIALVVIGILIALQINNWNNERIRKIEEVEVLESFVLELEAHLERIDEIKSFNMKVFEAAERLHYILNERIPYEQHFDSLFYIATNFTFGDQFSSAALDNLKSTGVDVITNQQLRNEIILVYDKFSYLREAQDLYVQMIVDAGQGLLSTRFEELWEGDLESKNPKGVMHPINYTSLFDDQEYLYFIRSIPNHLGWFVFKPCQYTKTAIENVLQLLKTELK
ncbi:MAG: DUF6090 family protein, partial [Melioribacteraceae bacterium]|nr:DUF6090 family protein [Melioribacteraceae bacterium]